MRCQIEREIERGNEAARADGNAFPHAHIAFCACRNIQRLDFAIISHRFFGCDPERVDQTSDFALGILDRLSRLDTEGV